MVIYVYNLLYIEVFIYFIINIMYIDIKYNKILFI